MQRHFQSRAATSVRKMRLLAGMSIEELAAAVDLPPEKFATFESSRARLKAPVLARVYAVCFQVLAARLRALVPGSDLPRGEELQRLLEQCTDLDVEIPFELPV